MPKRKTMTVAITLTQRKSRGCLSQTKYQERIYKGKQRHYIHIWQELTKHPMQKQTEVNT